MLTRTENKFYSNWCSYCGHTCGLDGHSVCDESGQSESYSHCCGADYQWNTRAPFIFTCDHCDEDFSFRDELEKHLETCNEEAK